MVQNKCAATLSSWTSTWQNKRHKLTCSLDDSFKIKIKNKKIKNTHTNAIVSNVIFAQGFTWRVRHSWRLWQLEASFTHMSRYEEVGFFPFLDISKTTSRQPTWRWGRVTCWDSCKISWVNYKQSLTPFICSRNYALINVL